MNRTGSLLSSRIVKHLASAATTGVVVYFRPARMPKRVRRGFLATNSAGSIAAMLVGSSSPSGAAQPAPLAKRVGPNAPLIGDAATFVASLASSASLVASRPMLRLDGRVERVLVRRGVRHPRLIMAVTAAGVVVAVGVAVDRLSRSIEEKVAAAQENAGGATSTVNPPVTGR